MRAFTNLNQSKVLAEILPVESADMCYSPHGDKYRLLPCSDFEVWKDKAMPAWSLAALLDVIKDKCGYFELVYLKRTSDGRANPLEDVYRLSTDVYDVYKAEPVDACYEMILILHEQKLL